MFAARFSTSILVAAALASSACDDNSSEPMAPCTQPVEMDVEFTNEFVIRWSPKCGVARLSVASPPSVGLGLAYWTITSETSSIASPVNFGVVPPGAVQIGQSPVLLLSGDVLAIQLRSATGGIVGQASVRVP
jgi:hypothetical protein